MPRRHYSDSDSSFYVSPVLAFLGSMVARHRDFWIWLGDLESWALSRELEIVAVDRPIYVCGLARSGSTLLHEIVTAHPRVATHRLKDFPLIHTPYWWRRATARRRETAPRERPHADRMLITTESPDAVEEMVWMAFLPHCHDPSHSNLMAAQDHYPIFEHYYRTHLRKLMLAEGANRYAAKNNYHVARIPYLLRLFPDARFLVPVREPESHIASLIRQQMIFSQGQRRHRRALAVMRWSGHFEFGLDRRPMNPGNHQRVRQIVDFWEQGQEVRGWACYWDMVYRYLADLLAGDNRVRSAVHAVRFEDLCANPSVVIQGVLDHAGLAEAESIRTRFVPRICKPDYYSTSFTRAERAAIQEETAATASLWGYEMS